MHFLFICQQGDHRNINFISSQQFYLIAIVTFWCTAQDTFFWKSVLYSVTEMSQWWRYYISVTLYKKFNCRVSANSFCQWTHHLKDELDNPEGGADEGLRCWLFRGYWQNWQNRPSWRKRRASVRSRVWGVQMLLKMKMLLTRGGCSECRKPVGVFKDIIEGNNIAKGGCFKCMIQDMDVWNWYEMCACDMSLCNVYGIAQLCEMCMKLCNICEMSMKLYNICEMSMTCAL